MKKTYRCKVTLPQFKNIILRTDAIPTALCSSSLGYFVWERSTKHNNYNGYSGYVSIEDIELIDKQDDKDLI